MAQWKASCTRSWAAICATIGMTMATAKSPSVTTWACTGPTWVPPSAASATLALQTLERIADFIGVDPQDLLNDPLVVSRSASLSASILGDLCHRLSHGQIAVRDALE